MLRAIVMTVAVLAVALAPLGIAWASHNGLPINYFSNANTKGAPDAQVRITHDGTSFLDLCAMIYVFRPDQQMAACCGCKITPNGLLTLSVNNDLTHNPLTADPLPTGVIKILGTLPTLTMGPPGSSPDCNPADPIFVSEFLIENPSIRAWGTHIQSFTPNVPFLITETEFVVGRDNVGFEELQFLQLECKAIVDGGLGKGLCKCPSENAKNAGLLP